MDSFEKYIKENRLRLDTEDLSEEAKFRLKNSLESRNRKLVFRKLYWIAGAIIVLFFSVLFMFNKSNTLPQNENIVTESEMPFNFAEEEHYFTQLVNQKMIIIQNESVQKENLVYFDSFILQLKTIDKQYQLCKHQIDKQGYTEELIQQVIYIYQLKLSVLEMMQHEINKINKRTKNQSHEKEKIRIY